MTQHCKNLLCLAIVAVSLSWLLSCGGSSPPVQTASIVGDGTGAAPDTIVEGVITGFGSVIVSGIKFDVNQASFTVDGVSGRSQADLRVGMVARISGTVNSSAATGVAKQVVYESTLIGTVESRSSTGAQTVTLQLLGQTVQAGGSTVVSGADNLQSIPAGALVEVSGFRDAQGRINATWIDVKANAQRAPELFGVIEALTATTFRIGQLTVNYAGAQIDNAPSGGLRNGLVVRVNLQSVPQQNTATATRVQVRMPEYGPGIQFASVQGLVIGYTAGASQFKVDERVVRITAQTTYINGNAQTLANDMRIQVNGRVATDGAIEAQQVIFIPSQPNADARARVVSVDAPGNTLKLLSNAGITVQTDSTTLFTDVSGSTATGPFSLAAIKAGDTVQVVGEERPGAVLRALVLQRLSALPVDITVITGAAANIAAPRLSVLGVTVDTTNALLIDARGAQVNTGQFFAALTPGKVVQVQGPYINGVLQAQKVSINNP
jgi:hypothetical protein